MPQEGLGRFGADCTCVHAFDLYCAVLTHVLDVSEDDEYAVGVQGSVPNSANGGQSSSHVVSFVGGLNRL